MMRDKVEISIYAFVWVLLALQLALIALRLCNVISSPWWLVALPTLASIALAFAILLGWIAMLVAENWDYREKRKRRLTHE